MANERFLFQGGPADGEIRTVPSAPARVIVGDSGAIIDVSSLDSYPCYIRYELKRNDTVEYRYEYEGEPPARA